MGKFVWFYVVHCVVQPEGRRIQEFRNNSGYVLAKHFAEATEKIENYCTTEKRIVSFEITKLERRELKVIE